VTSVRTDYCPKIRDIGIRLLLVAGLAMTVGCRAEQSGSLSQPVENSSGSSKAEVKVRPSTDASSSKRRNGLLADATSSIESANASPATARGIRARLAIKGK
jgi:hypothetical protein